MLYYSIINSKDVTIAKLKEIHDDIQNPHGINMQNRTGNKTIAVRFTDEEYKLIHKKMKLLGTNNMSAYARKMLIDGLIIESNHEDFDKVAYELKEAQTKYKFLNVMINYKETRNNYKDIYKGFKTSKDKTKYSVEHSREIALYKAAVTEIKKHYPNGAIPTLESMIIDRDKLNKRIIELKPKYDQAKKDYAVISKLKKKIDVTIAKGKNYIKG